jgi:hypothetical protein
MRLSSAIVCVAALLVYPVRSYAEEPRGCMPSRVGSEDLARLDRGLEQQRRSARVWFWSWLTLYASAAGVSAALAATSRTSADADLQSVNAVSAGIGLLGLLLPPLPRLAGPPPRIPGASPEAELAGRLARLERAAEQETFLRSWLAHAGNVAVGAGAGLYLGLRGGDPWAVALPTGLLSITVGLAQILTTPRAATHLRNQYARGPRGIAVSPLPRGIGLGLRTDF